MINKFRQLLSTQTVKQSFVSSTSTVINGLLGICFYILLGRFLGPEKFGIFSIVILTTTLIADIANVGTDTGIIRFVGKYRKVDPEKALRFIKLGFEIKLAVGLLVLAIGWFATPALAQFVGKEELAYILRYALLGSLGVLLFSLTTSAIQAFEKYLTWGILNVSLNTLRLVGVVALFYLGSLTTETSLQVYILLPFIGFVVGSFFLPNYFKVKEGFLVSKEFFHYNKWVALFILIAAVSARLDSYLGTKFLSLRDLGVYSAAVTIAGVGSQVVAGIATVVAPKMAAMNTRIKAIAYLKNLQFFVLGLALVGLIIGLPLASYLIPKLLGVEYLESVRPFIFLYLAQLIFLISIPAHSSIFYYFSKPSLFVWISLGHLLIIGILGWLLIPLYSYMGAALAVLIGTLWNFLVPFIWVVVKLKDEN